MTCITFVQTYLLRCAFVKVHLLVHLRINNILNILLVNFPTIQRSLSIYHFQQLVSNCSKLYFRARFQFVDICKLQTILTLLVVLYNNNSPNYLFLFSLNSSKRCRKRVSLNTERLVSRSSERVDLVRSNDEIKIHGDI